MAMCSSQLDPAKPNGKKSDSGMHHLATPAQGMQLDSLHKEIFGLKSSLQAKESAMHP